MRLWSLHPKYLDTPGLSAVWRESLLALKVLQGETKGYRQHPQLERFKTTEHPINALACYLQSIYLEAENRGYRFDKSKIPTKISSVTLDVTEGQLGHEWQHFLGKIQKRKPHLYEALKDLNPEPHPLFRIVPGDVASWEKIHDTASWKKG